MARDDLPGDIGDKVEAVVANYFELSGKKLRLHVNIAHFEVRCAFFGNVKTQEKYFLSEDSAPIHPELPNIDTGRKIGLGEGERSE